MILPCHMTIIRKIVWTKFRFSFIIFKTGTGINNIKLIKKIRKKLKFFVCQNLSKNILAFLKIIRSIFFSSTKLTLNALCFTLGGDKNKAFNIQLIYILISIEEKQTNNSCGHWKTWKKEQFLVNSVYLLTQVSVSIKKTSNSKQWYDFISKYEP